jgi:hypothetical protein
MPAPPPELAPRRAVNWRLALGLGGILAVIGGGSAAYVLLKADKRDTTTPAADRVATTDVPTTTSTTEASSTPPPKRTRATAPENTMRRHLQALADQDYAAAFAEFSAGPGGSSEATWTARNREYDASVAIGSIDEVSRDASGADVKVSFYTHDSGDAPGATEPDQCAWFHGTVHLVNQGGRWLYEPPRPGGTKLSKNFIKRSDPRCAELLD